MDSSLLQRADSETQEQFHARIWEAEKDSLRPPFFEKGESAAGLCRIAIKTVLITQAKCVEVPSELFFDLVWLLTCEMWPLHQLEINESSRSTGHARWKKSMEEEIDNFAKKGLIARKDGNYQWVGELEVVAKTSVLHSVYFLQEELTNNIRIGCSSELDNRLETHRRSSSGVKRELIKLFEGYSKVDARRVESYFQAQFIAERATDQKRGNSWYRLSPSQIARVKKISSEEALNLAQATGVNPM